MREPLSADAVESTFHDVDLSKARFENVDLTRARFREVDFTGAVLRSCALVDVEISGRIEKLTVNGVDVAPLVETELNRRYPDRVKMRPDDADGFRDAWQILERLWDYTIERARSLPESSLHERVDGEWSFIETLRHLLFATDAWVSRAILGDPAPWDALDLPHDDMPEEPSVPRDRVVKPSLDEVLALRSDRVATVSAYLGTLDDARLNDTTVPVDEEGYPEHESFPVRQCLRIVLNEEWSHRLYAERDLDTLLKVG